MIEPKYRTFWRRFWAGLLDGLLFVPVIWIDAIFLESGSRVIATIWFVTRECAFLVYSITLHGRFGRTLGKAALRIRVIDQSENRRITFRQAFLRDSPWVAFTALNLALRVPVVLRGGDPYAANEILLNSAGSLWLLGELTSMLFSSRRRAVHDLLAGSVVILESSIDTSAPPNLAMQRTGFAGR